MDKHEKFLRLVDSLRLYRRANIKDGDKNLIEDLYVDPLNGDLILKAMLKPHTTLLIGRKGTGKSTIINRFQYEIRKKDNEIALYIDVNSVYDSAKNSSLLPKEIIKDIPETTLMTFYMYREFISSVLESLKEEIKEKLFISKIEKFFLRDKNKYTKEEFFQKLEEIFKKAINSVDDLTFQKLIIKEIQLSNKNELNINGKVSLIETSLESKVNDQNVKLEFEQFSKVLIRSFNIIHFMKDLKNLLKEVGLKRVFICLDDMSELDKNSIEVFVKTIIAPLNNNSDEFYKFKMALYPGRDYLPDIDRMKVETFNLDYYNLYAASGVDKVEEKAIAYTKKLLDKRFEYFFGSDFKYSDFFDIKSYNMEYYFKILFQMSANVPRILGKILFYALQKTENLSKFITKRILQESAKQHYIDEIEREIKKVKYIKYSHFEEQFEAFHLKNLLEEIIKKAKHNKRQIAESKAKIFEKYNISNAPSNYLFVKERFENYLKTLEFNFFITRYSNQKDKDGNDVSVFTLNYGLCQKENIIFDEGSDRKFRIERLFDYTNLILKWIRESKELICNYCNEKFPFEDKEKYEIYDYLCPKCRKGKLIEKPSNLKLEKSIDKEIELDELEYKVLVSLNIISPQLPKELGQDLDVTYQKITKKVLETHRLEELGFIKRLNRKVTITEEGRKFLNGNS